MVLTPGFYQQTHQPRKRGRRERWVVGIGAVVTILIVAVALISLTSHAGKSRNGCLNFSYAMVMGSEIVHECGSAARKLCADPQRAAHAQGNIAGLENDLIDKLPQNCREAGLPFSSGS